MVVQGIASDVEVVQGHTVASDVVVVHGDTRTSSPVQSARPQNDGLASAAPPQKGRIYVRHFIQLCFE